MIKFAEEIQKEELFHIIGDYSATDCKNHLIGGIGAGMATLGVGGVAGAFAGAHVGAIAGGLTCVGGMLFNGK
ncbi:bacteriocin class II with double-glycine leader peptide family protein [Streptococcus pyogenes]|uniref:Blp family class II bacteriocin n=1 Tax=Streptococcus pyogenes TaxID=1314 RepID=UPI0010A1010D|nr:Blp family class II bacteriocin [Streptococcus pyogenes]VGU78702.1 bacteriocin class II with double-glycine leader peptide family protein [Streptococcus pyogenes]VGV04027.1 bacteriocin class II with double-glycine leader peptide family protein [Streptococcus pyogenes]VHB65565.1 bacteriocin class II with double-glycine leader peptide family protein [Streptococcus pyogenes]VHB68726.1 bacteriocin class II with double-glycine leader peptide family protein [Streptococcus pyogenes]